MEQLRKGPLHDAPVGEHVAHAGRDAQIVFEDDEFAVVQAQKIAAHDGDINIARNLQAAHLAAIVLAAVDKLARNNAIAENLGVEVNVAQEEIECRNALYEAALNAIPFRGRDQAGQQVVGEDALSSLFAPVHRKSDSLGQKREFCCLLTSLEFILRQLCQGLRQRLIVGAHLAVRLPHLVKGAIERVISEKRFHFGRMTGAHGEWRVLCSRFRGRRIACDPAEKAWLPIPFKIVRRSGVFSVPLLLTRWA